MADSLQVLTYDDIRKEVGFLEGFGRVIEDWDTRQTEWVASSLLKGTNKFYLGSSHDWSFLKPLSTLTIKEDTDELVLPEEFAFLEGGIYFTDNYAGEPLEIENDARVLRRRNTSTTTTGRPQFACIVARRQGVTTQQRQVLEFWPTADDDYEVTLKYSILPEALSTANKYPWGGQAHSNTILEACLSASEQMAQRQPYHTQLYMQALAASIEYDKKVKAQTVAQEHRWKRPYRYSNIVTTSDTFYTS